MLHVSKRRNMISLFFGCSSFLTLPTPNIQCQIQGEMKFFRGRQLFLLGTCLLQRSIHLVILFSTCHPNFGFLLILCPFLEEIILCYLTLFSQVYFFRYLIKNFKVSICITLMYMVDLLLSIYCLQGENLVHVDTLMSHIYILL